MNAILTRGNRVNPYFSSVSISGWRQFQNVSIDFHPRLTVITGSNGAGKSTLLNLLTPQFGWQRAFLGTPGKRRANGLQRFLTGIRGRGQLQQGASTQVGEMTYSNGVSGAIYVANEGQQYGVGINNQHAVIGTFIPSHRAPPVFRPVTQINASSILPDQAYGVFQSESVQRFLGNHSQGTIYRLKETLISMAMFGARSEISSGDEYALAYFRDFVDVLRIILPESLGFRDLSIRVTDVVMETTTGSFVIDAASGGVMSLIDIAWQIYAFSKTSQANSAASFTVVMDEPENHLHPSMQRTLLGNLLKAFPKAQFIVATHSPFMVSSVKESTVYALRYVPVEVDSSSEDVDEGPSLKSLVFSEKLDVVNRAGNASEILRDVLGVPVTVPLWVEHQLNILVDEYRNREITLDALKELRSRMAELGFGELYPSVLAGVVQHA